MKNLTELKLFLPRFSLEESNFNPKKLVSLINPNLKELLIKKGKDTEEIWSSITINKGSVQHLNFLSC